MPASEGDGELLEPTLEAPEISPSSNGTAPDTSANGADIDDTTESITAWLADSSPNSPRGTMKRKRAEVLLSTFKDQLDELGLDIDMLQGMATSEVKDLIR